MMMMMMMTYEPLTNRRKMQTGPPQKKLQPDPDITEQALLKALIYGGRASLGWLSYQSTTVPLVNRSAENGSATQRFGATTILSAIT